ncbi:MAG TPA: hypothetical protein VGN20_09525 [Mucilaginibacter sp.]
MLGKDENKISFPFSTFIKYGKSGKLDLKNIKPKNENQNSRTSTTIRYLKNLFFSDAVVLSSVIDIFSSLQISREFLNWVNDFNPDFIYTQPGSRQSIRFIKRLHELTSIPLVVHIMDDWPNVIGNGLFQRFRAKKTNDELKQLLDQTKIFLSISDGMSEEYFSRYGKRFKSFHNTVDVKKWLPFSKKDFNISNEIKILYAGRIGLGTYHAFVDLILAIEELNKAGSNIYIHIQTPQLDNNLRKKLTKFAFVKFNPYLDYAELPKVFSIYDLLLLPIDFQSKGQRFLKFSMPTKVPEFMISGVPILLYCPANVYLSSHAERNEWAYIINEKEKKTIKHGILNLIDNKAIREKISKNAVEYAINNFSADVVTEKFRLMFCNDDDD